MLVDLEMRYVGKLSITMITTNSYDKHCLLILIICIICIKRLADFTSRHSEVSQDFLFFFFNYDFSETVEGFVFLYGDLLRSRSKALVNQLYFS
jgi:hypothetical protein